MPDLEQRLRAVAPDVDWPATPDLATAVVGRIARGGAARERRGSLRRPRLALAVVLAVLVPATGALAFPSARDDVLEWLGVKGVTVERAEELPPIEELGVAHIGRPVSLDEAARLAGYPVALPGALGPPGHVRFDAPTRTVVTVHGNVVVFQAPGALDREVVRKIVTTSTQVHAVSVDGRPGMYLSGLEHAVLLGRPDGETGGARPAADTLVFSRGDTVVRIEAETLPLQRALEIARSMR
jgi:hypothetical protein